MLNIFKLFDILLPLLNKIINQMIDIETREKGNSVCYISKTASFRMRFKS